MVSLMKQHHTVGLQIYIIQVQQHMCALPEYYHTLGKPGFLSKAMHRNGRDAVSQASLLFELFNDNSPVMSK